MLLCMFVLLPWVRMGTLFARPRQRQYTDALMRRNRGDDWHQAARIPQTVTGRVIRPPLNEWAAKGKAPPI